ncbi:DUF6470 family protein [Paenibacillus protaetiae]|uniref:Uncharacterized protein n=1 Tax=Paenibacillus protaetiae TaxID=2509456 RepID=A0A4P6EXF7_9BACL|nr:DUF6470 family protein [Paenibacillus protaetiae]QAY67754.1 hypothetical protein ET464_16545 [Paenibacillus protaetiae]
MDIHSQNAVIGLHTEPGKFQIRQGKAQLNLATVPAKLDIHSTPPVVLVDQSRLRAAMNGGSMSEMNHRIYSQLPGLVQQGIRNTNAKWEQIGNLHDGDSHPIATVAKQEMFRERTPIRVTAEPSSDNVSFQAVLKKPEVHYIPGGIEGGASVTPPQISYQRGGVQTYMKQTPSVTVEVKNLDLTI